LELSRLYVAAGLSVIPIRADGSKAPALASWTEYQSRWPTDAELVSWFGSDVPGIGLAIVCGAVSGHLEVIDFDSVELFETWLTTLRHQSPALIPSLTVISTPEGRHVYLRLPGPVPRNRRLARDMTGKTVIETRGEGGYVLAPGCPPSCHPTGGLYHHLSGPPLDQLASRHGYESMIDLAQSLNRYVKPGGFESHLPAAAKNGNPAGLRPGDAFNSRATWDELLTPRGWVITGTRDGLTHWRRPGKPAPGMSATTGFRSECGKDLLYVFSTNALPFEADTSYSKFSAYALLEHHGDFHAAAAALARDGYGDPDPLAGVTIIGITPAAQVAESSEDYQPFPVNSLPRPICDFVAEGAKALGCNVSYLALPVLSVSASAIGNTRTIRLKRGWEEPSVIWGASIGDSGVLKSPAFFKAVSPLFRRQKRILDDFENTTAHYRKQLEQHKVALKTAREKGLERPEAPDPPRLRRVVCSDTTIEKLATVLHVNPRGTLVARDELSGWLGSFERYRGSNNSTDLPNWLEMYRAGTVIVDRKTAEHPTLFIHRAAVSVIGGIQPGVLARALTPNALEAGLAARLLMTLPPKHPKRWSEVEIAWDLELAYEELIDGLLGLDFDLEEGQKVPLAMGFAPEAKNLWVQFYNDWAREQADAEGELAACWSKLEGYAAPLILLHHVINCVHPKVDDRRPIGTGSVEAGVTLTRWFASEARRIYSLLSESAEERQTRRLVEFIRARGGKIAVRDLVRSNSRKWRNIDLARAGLNALVTAGLGYWTEVPSGPQGGRPCQIFVLAPDTTATTRTPTMESVNSLRDLVDARHNWF
jgi:hypothetical protein